MFSKHLLGFAAGLGSALAFAASAVAAEPTANAAAQPPRANDSFNFTFSGGGRMVSPDLLTDSQDVLDVTAGVKFRVGEGTAYYAVIGWGGGVERGAPDTIGVLGTGLYLLDQQLRVGARLQLNEYEEHHPTAGLMDYEHSLYVLGEVAVPLWVNDHVYFAPEVYMGRSFAKDEGLASGMGLSMTFVIPGAP